MLAGDLGLGTLVPIELGQKESESQLPKASHSLHWPGQKSLQKTCADGGRQAGRSCPIPPVKDDGWAVGLNGKT